LVINPEDSRYYKLKLLDSEVSAKARKIAEGFFNNPNSEYDIIMKREQVRNITLKTSLDKVLD
jgi:hypothetical protein